MAKTTTKKAKTEAAEPTNAGEGQATAQAQAQGAGEGAGQDSQEQPQTQAPAQAAPQAPAPPAPPAPPQEQDQPPVVVAAPVFVAEVSGNQSKQAVDLLLDACELFGVNPEQDQRPVELLSWRYRAANRVEQIPASVTLVTAGGQKLVHYADPSYPMDPDTIERLRNVFNAYRKDKDGTRIPLPLPTDLTLPEGAVTGLVASDDHVYRRGYLREGGRTESQRRRRQ